MGDKSASGSEHVNLYYDGEYRGLYLLCEKPEINSGRIDELDYQDMIDEWSERNGLSDLTSFAVSNAINKYGNEYTYMEKIPQTDKNDGMMVCEYTLLVLKKLHDFPGMKKT